MKTFLIILGIVLFALGVQDGIRLLVNNEASSIFSWVSGDYTFHIGFDVALATAGALLASRASRPKTS